MTLTRRRGSRAGALVVAESLDHAALNHDRALRTLFACDYPRRRARIGSALLLHFGQNLIEWQPHQRGRNLGLLLLIVGDADGVAGCLVAPAAKTTRQRRHRKTGGTRGADGPVNEEVTGPA